MAFPGAAPGTSTIRVNVFDGTRSLIAPKTDVLFTIRDDRGIEIVRETRKPADATFSNLRFYDQGDGYAVTAWARGYDQAGFHPVRATPDSPATVDVMLLPSLGSFNFAGARWEDIKALRPKLAKLLAAGAADDDAARQRYMDLHEKEPVLACLLNITTAMDQIPLPDGTALDYFKILNWDDTMKQDRFYGYADRKLLEEVQKSAKGEFAPELGFALFHKGATNSYKEIRFGEANVQLTFHEDDAKKIDGVDCVLMEPDIDYFKDLAAHGLLEVIPNGFTGALTDPAQVYVLRWMAAKQHNMPDFEPMYTIS